MANDQKGLIRALVQDNKRIQEDQPGGSSDVIKGKGGGVIFLLHGPPGVGKTLTAEAIAELLHYPLYRYVLPGEQQNCAANHLHT